MPGEGRDKIDRVQAQWRAEAPQLDTAPIGVLGRINRIADLAGRRIAAVFEAHGLDRGEFDVLATLTRHGPPYELTPTDLYRELMISSGGLTHRLKGLEGRGLVERVKTSADGRSLGVKLTEAGRTLVLAAYADDLALEAVMLKGLNGRERATLEGLLRRLHLSLGEKR